jgi:hypothetical protein
MIAWNNFSHYYLKLSKLFLCNLQIFKVLHSKYFTYLKKKINKTFVAYRRLNRTQKWKWKFIFLMCLFWSWWTSLNDSLITKLMWYENNFLFYGATNSLKPRSSGFDVSTSRTVRHSYPVGLVWTCDQLVTEGLIPTQHTLKGIRTHDASDQALSVLCLRPHGHRNR